VAVIGGGMAGLSAAHALVRRGAKPVVFEAGERPGGKVASNSERGWLTEDGPNFLSRPLDALLEAAGLRGEMVRPSGLATRFVHLRGRVLKAPSLPLLLAAGLPRALLEPLFARPLREDVSLQEFLVARLGKRAGSLAAALMAAGVYAGDPAQLSARDAFPSLSEPGSILLNASHRPRAALWSLRRGLGSLPEAAATKLDVRLGAKVTGLAPASGAWDVQAGGTQERFEAVVLAVPAAAARELARDFAPRLAEALGEFRAAPIALVHLGFPQDGLPRGFGLLDADGTMLSVGTLFPSSMLPGRAPEGRALLTAICGGARHPERAALPDAALVAGVCAELRKTLGVKSDPEYVRIVRHAEAIPQYAPGHRERVRRARELLAGLPRIELAGAAYDGVSVPDVVQSGAAAAERIYLNNRG
jgi:oxygen-dependent protoporphyrinogen oxidase